ncbi:nickel pincer cofactor biosynthesis protein LarB [Sporolactobacillus sp. KGMB 08714]|uniref:nickel pincer cofactor biosynthesis protein LarB n=1 Tax=Sporolactobacillus sp. KGMB 08714 TaxID=3064704 RepID=UPI002FBEC1C6
MKFVDIDIAKVDIDRVNRKGFSEVIYSSGKTAKQIKQIIQVLLDKDESVLATRVSQEKYNYLTQYFTDLHYDVHAEILTTGRPNPELKKGALYVVCAGTSDLKIAWETIDVAKWMGIHVEHIFDIGVAGLHRLLSYQDELQKADVIIAIAGMEGSLPTVVAGLVDAPVIAVPTSIGYGANLQGITTMLSMLTSCSSGMTVTNIDNGFGAAYQAGLMIKRMNRSDQS